MKITVEGERTTKRLADTLARVREHSQLTQKEVAERMETTQASIARLESGTQSPSIRTLQGFAHANGFCLEISFVRSVKPSDDLGSIIVLEDSLST